MFSKKLQTAGFFILIFSVVLLMSVNTSIAISWDDIDFPKIMDGSPTTYYIWYNNTNVPAPNPWIQASYWDELDEMGINVMSNHIDVYKDVPDIEYFGELYPNLNTKNIAYLCNPTVNGDDQAKYHLSFYRTALAYEKWAGDFYGRMKVEVPGIATQIYYNGDDRNVYKGIGSELVSNQDPFLSSHAPGNDFFFCPIYFDEQYVPRTGHFIMKAHATHNTSEYECHDDIPLLEVKIWESKRWHSSQYFTGWKQWIFNFDDNGLDLELSTNPMNFDLSAYAKLNPSMDDMEYRWFADDGVTDVQYNIEFKLGKVYEPGTSIPIAVDVFIDWFGIYDDRGWMSVASLNPEINFVPDPVGPGEQPYPSTFEDLAQGIRDHLEQYFIKEGNMTAANGVILDFDRDDVPPHALKSFFNLDTVVYNYTNIHQNRIYRYYPNENWESFDHTSTVFKQDYYSFYDEAPGYDPPEVVYSWFYPLKKSIPQTGNNQPSLQELLSFNVDQNLQFMITDIIGDNDLINLIQCQASMDEDEVVKRYREPYNIAEILVQGYLVLAYGCKGIGYYPYNPHYEDPNSANPWIDRTGVFIADGINPWQPALCGNDVDFKKDAITQLNQDIDILAPCLNNLNIAVSGDEVRGGCFGYSYQSYDPQPTNLQYINASLVSYTDPIEITEFEIISGQEQNITAGDYFMVVNRDCENMNTVAIATFNTNEQVTYAEDMATHFIYSDDLGGNGHFDFTCQIPPGCGKLFRIFTTSNQTLDWWGNINIKGDYAIPDGWTLMLNTQYSSVPCTVSVINDIDALNNKTGGIIVNEGSNIIINPYQYENVVFQSKYHSKGAAAAADNEWVGIRFHDDPYDPTGWSGTYLDDFETINADSGMVFYGCQGNIQISNATFTDCEVGISALENSQINISNTKFDAVVNPTNLSVYGNSSIITIANCSDIFNTLKVEDSSQLSITNCEIGEDYINTGISASNSDVTLNAVTMNGCLYGIVFDGSGSQTLAVTNSSLDAMPAGLPQGINIEDAILNISDTEFSDFDQAIISNTCEIEIDELIYDYLTTRSNNQYIIDITSPIGIYSSITNSKIRTDRNGIKISGFGLGVPVQDRQFVIADCNVKTDGSNYSSFGIYVDGNNRSELILSGHHSVEYRTIKGFKTGLYCDGIKISTDWNPISFEKCIIAENSDFGAKILNAASGSSFKNTVFDDNGSSQVYNTGGIYLENSSPIFNACFIENNTGPAVWAHNTSLPEFGTIDEEHQGNHFEGNTPANGISAIIYETGNSFSRLDERHNNLLLGTMSYFIENGDQNQRRFVEHNYWGGEPQISQFIPSETNAWDWDPYCPTEHTIGSGGLGGGGEMIGLELAITLEGSGQYEPAVEAYAGFADTTVNMVEKQVALCRILASSLAGELTLDTLIAYYGSFVPGGPPVDPATPYGQLVKTAARLTTKVKKNMGDYVGAILDYEQMLQGNPTTEDSVYAVIEAGEAYLKMAQNGQSIQSQNPPVQPAMAELEPDSLEAYEEMKWELLNMLYGGGSGLSGGGLSGEIMLLPEKFDMHQNYPNPFNSETIIKYDLPEPSEVKIEVYNIMGQLVATLMDGIQSAGYKSVKWNGSIGDSKASIASGIYIYKIKAKGRASEEKFNKVCKLLLLK